MRSAGNRVSLLGLCHLGVEQLRRVRGATRQQGAGATSGAGRPPAGLPPIPYLTVSAGILFRELPALEGKRWRC